MNNAEALRQMHVWNLELWNKCTITQCPHIPLKNCPLQMPDKNVVIFQSFDAEMIKYVDVFMNTHVIKFE